MHLKTLAAVFFVGILAGSVFLWLPMKKVQAQAGPKIVWVVEDGLELPIRTEALTVGEFLEQNGLKIGEYDQLWPNVGHRLFEGNRIIIARAKRIVVSDKESKKEYVVWGATVQQALWERPEIGASEDDLVTPVKNSALKDGMVIKLTRVKIEEKIVNEPIDFAVEEQTDEKMSWRERKIVQKGERGVREAKYKLVYHDGKEISRKLLEKRVAKEPIKEIVIQGSYVKTGKTHKGLASWYAWTGTMAAANPWLPMGSYVKVTNLDNGKSVIVKINDRGPFGPGRIIDLDKVAFAKIASIGAGIVNVKMEEITN